MSRNLRRAAPRRALLLSLTALVSITWRAASASAQVVPPPIERIDVGRDTVWFVAGIDRADGRREPRRRWALARRSGAWLAVDRQAPPALDRAEGGRDSLAAARDFATLHARRWRLPDSETLALAVSGDSLFVGTRDALAVYDEVTGRVDVRWFHATPVARRRPEGGAPPRDVVSDSTIEAQWSLVANRDSREELARLIVEMGRLLSPLTAAAGSRWSAGAYLDVVRRIPDAHFDSALAGDTRDLGRALAHPLLAPFLVRDTTAARDSLSLPVVRAIGLLGDRRNLAYLQWALSDSSAADPRVFLDGALARARLGDSSWVIRLARELKRTPEMWPAFVLRLDRDADVRTAVFANDSLARALTHALVGVLAIPLRADSARVPRLREAHESAVHLAVATADTIALPYVLALMTQDSLEYVLASTALIQFTGISPVVGGPRSPLAERASAQRFWSDWLRENATRLRRVGIEQGDRAVAEWMRR